MSAQPPARERYLMRDSMGARRAQQDAAVCLVNPKAKVALVVLCDGVGGSRDGGGAARAIVKCAEEYWKEKGEVFESPEEDLASLAEQAQRRIQVENEDRGPSAQTTVVALYRTAKQAHWMHSGDSRLYHFRKGRIVTRTRDHSVVEILVQQGQVSESEMGSHPDQGKLLQSLGGTDYKEPTFASSVLTADDAFLLCTDGFWERTTTDEMADILYAERPLASELLDQAVKRAVRRNGVRGDNVTVAVVLPERGAARQGKFGFMILLGLLLLPELLYVVYRFWLTRHP